MLCLIKRAALHMRKPQCVKICEEACNSYFPSLSLGECVFRGTVFTVLSARLLPTFQHCENVEHLKKSIEDPQVTKRIDFLCRFTKLKSQRKFTVFRCEGRQTCGATTEGIGLRDRNMSKTSEDRGNWLLRAYRGHLSLRPPLPPQPVSVHLISALKGRSLQMKQPGRDPPSGLKPHLETHAASVHLTGKTEPNDFRLSSVQFTTVTRFLLVSTAARSTDHKVKRQLVLLK